MSNTDKELTLHEIQTNIYNKFRSLGKWFCSRRCMEEYASQQVAKLKAELVNMQQEQGKLKEAANGMEKAFQKAIDTLIGIDGIGAIESNALRNRIKNLSQALENYKKLKG